MSHSKNLKYSNASGAITFSYAGTYQFTITWTESNAGGAWSAFRLQAFVSDTTVGTSSAFYMTASDASIEAFAVTFFATIDDTSEVYTLDLGRDSSSYTFDVTINAIGSFTPPVMLCNIVYLG